MARPVSQFLRIINQIELDVNKVTTANDFITEMIPEAIHLLPNKWKSFNIFPHCFITYHGGTKTDLYNSRGSKVTKIVRLIFFLRDSGVKNTLRQIADLETDLNWLWRELNPTLKEDSTGEGLVTKIKMVNDQAHKVEHESYEVWTCDMEVTYHNKWSF